MAASCSRSRTSDEDPAFLEAQQAVLRHLATHVDVTPRVVTTTSGAAFAELTDDDTQAASRLGGEPSARAAAGARASPRRSTI